MYAADKFEVIIVDTTHLRKYQKYSFHYGRRDFSVTYMYRKNEFTFTWL